MSTRIRKPNGEGYMTTAEFRDRIQKLCGYPKWVVKACDRVVEKPDNEPLTNTETDAMIRYLHGDNQ